MDAVKAITIRFITAVVFSTSAAMNLFLKFLKPKVIHIRKCKLFTGHFEVLLSWKHTCTHASNVIPSLPLCIKIELQVSPQIFELHFVIKIRPVHSYYVPWFI
jgi:hypothetical protein